MTDKEKAVGLGLQVRDLCIKKGVTRDNAETASLLVQQTALQMAEWKEQQMIDKAVEWLEKNVDNYKEFKQNWIDIETLVGDFKQSMKEE